MWSNFSYLTNTNINVVDLGTGSGCIPITLKKKLPNINIEELLADTYCINQEMTTRQNNRGSQIGRNINFIISDYGYDFDDEVSAQILQSVEILSDEQLSNIISKGVDAQEICSLLIKTREDDERIENAKYNIERTK